MADLGRLKKSRTAHRNVLFGLITKAENFSKEGPGEGQDVDVNTTLKLVKAKEDVISKINEKIWDAVDEKDIETEIEECSSFEEKVMHRLAKLTEYLEEKKMKKAPVTLEGKKDSDSDSGYLMRETPGVKLQKIVIKKFSGDPVAWKQFEEIFNATVHSNSKLTDIEKFSYLKGYLCGTAEKCIEGLPLTNENYKEAWTLLVERFGNPQLIIA